MTTTKLITFASLQPYDTIVRLTPESNMYDVIVEREE